jgi:hypothetical protein
MAEDPIWCDPAVSQHKGTRKSAARVTNPLVKDLLPARDRAAAIPETQYNRAVGSSRRHGGEADHQAG